MTGVKIHYCGPIVTREEALTKGLKRFFEGKVCRHGHISERNTKSRDCIACIIKRQREAPPKVITPLTRKRLLEVLDYDPDTGIFKWKIKRGGVLPGQVAGSLTEYGYIRINIDGRLYMAHVLAHLYVTGEWPKKHIDHRNIVTSDNSWDNLRNATRPQNGGNRPSNKNNKSGYKGVTWHKQIKRWCAQIGINGTVKHIGSFEDKVLAARAYDEAALEHFGEFAWLNFPDVSH